MSMTKMDPILRIETRLPQKSLNQSVLRPCRAAGRLKNGTNSSGP